MNAYELYIAGRKACWILEEDTFDMAEIKAAAHGKTIPNLTHDIDLPPRELRKYNRMRKYLKE